MENGAAAAARWCQQEGSKERSAPAGSAGSGAKPHRRIRGALGPQRAPGRPAPGVAAAAVAVPPAGRQARQQNRVKLQAGLAGGGLYKRGAAAADGARLPGRRLQLLLPQLLQAAPCGVAVAAPAAAWGRHPLLRAAAAAGRIVDGIQLHAGRGPGGELRAPPDRHFVVALSQRQAHTLRASAAAAAAAPTAAATGAAAAAPRLPQHRGHAGRRNRARRRQRRSQQQQQQVGQQRGMPAPRHSAKGSAKRSACSGRLVRAQSAARRSLLGV